MAVVSQELPEFPESHADQLIIKLQKGQGDRKELESQLLKAIKPLVLHYAKNYTADPHQQMDILDRILLKVSQKWPTFKTDMPIAGWLRTVTRNTAYNIVKSTRKHVDGRHPDSDEIIAQVMLDEKEEELPHDAKEILAEALMTVKKDFAPKTMRAFELLAFQGKTASEASTELKMSVGAVYTAKCRVLSAVREEALKIWDQRNR